MGCTLTLLFSFFIFRRWREVQGKTETEEALAGFDSVPVDACVFPEVWGLNHSAICDHLVHQTHTNGNPAPKPVSRASLRYFSLLFAEGEPFLKYKYVLWCVCYACQLKDIFSYITFKQRGMTLACLNPGKCQM